MKRRINETLVSNVLYLLFGDYCEKIRSSKKQLVDENNNTDLEQSLQLQYKTMLLEELIRDFWGVRCQYLLSGVFLYLMKLDSYFDPKFNDYEHFFVKIYKNHKILTEIGKGHLKVIFPFKKFIKQDKKLVLIRC